MLSSLPRKPNTMDSQHGDFSSQRLQLCGIAQSLARDQAGRSFPNSEVLAEEDTGSIHATRKCESHCHPDVIGCIRRHMDMQQPQEDAGGDDVLKHEEFVTQTPEREEGADRNPCQYRPESKAVLDHRHHLQFNAHKIRPNPFTEKE